jgi:hypothetical protein
MTPQRPAAPTPRQVGPPQARRQGAPQTQGPKPQVEKQQSAPPRIQKAREKTSKSGFFDRIKKLFKKD